jgi:hypothetical protein
MPFGSYPQCLRAREARYILLVKLTSMALKIGRRHLPNSVCLGHVWCYGGVCEMSRCPRRPHGERGRRKGCGDGGRPHFPTAGPRAAGRVPGTALTRMSFLRCTDLTVTFSGQGQVNSTPM